ncbi:DNA-directed RNA polymerase I subunit rpa49 [Cryomyces antarcticus]|uniref:DNA-directed RNA polymerase I subunit rpa49 n=1 Tax=Cryomyces antarcticus TaxID=329879 RepID=A0ABR0LPD0_9PEZI|nr:DNA-directed RNA polymerase I subunit rpa49 [Cryomyces antarcticus]KAK5201390.1 DNA-directed RNA polymerase I subunit rpa49 [Cryomyces antarcticus]
MSDRKRKRSPEKAERPHDPAKKVAVAAPSATLKVTVLPESDGWCPIVGISLPSSIPLTPYKRSISSDPRILPPGHTSPPSCELLLQSSVHPNLDYLAREAPTGSADGVLAHYTAIYDPSTGSLQITPARKVTVRSTLRNEAAEIRDRVEASRAAAAARQSSFAQRQALSSEFGTKKARKAIASLTENAIASGRGRATSPGGTAIKQDASSAAVLDSMASSTDTMPDKAALQAAVDDAKPRPRANLAATTPADVYTLDGLIGADMRSIAVLDWQAAAVRNDDVRTPSRFVSRRLAAVAQGGDVGKLKALRYVLLLLNFLAALKPGRGGGRRLPPRDELEKKTGAAGALLDGIRRRFGDGGGMSKWHVDYLITHVAALSLVVDNFSSDTYDLKEDLRLENKQMSQYFHELGCKMSAPTEKEKQLLKLSKTEAAAHRIARLKLPLDFPKQRALAAKRR